MSNREIKFILRLRDEATAQWQKFDREIQAGIGRIKAGFSRFGPLLAGAFSVGALKEFIGASNEQEVASKKLDAALKNQGITSGATRKQMEDYSSALQKSTIFADEQITNIQAQLVAMTGLTGQAVQPLTKATLDLASGLNLDVESAGMLIAKTIEGKDALSRYGISVKGARTESEKISVILDQVNQKFGGLSEEIAKTTSGRLEQFKNQWNEVEETFGDIIKNVLAKLLPTVQALLELIASAPAPIQAMILSVGALTVAMTALGVEMTVVTGGLNLLLAAGIGFLVWLNDSGEEAEAATKSNKNLAASFDLLAKHVLNLSGKSSGVLESEREVLKKNIQVQEEYLKSVEDNIAANEKVGRSSQNQTWLNEIKTTKGFIDVLKDELRQYNLQIAQLKANESSTLKYTERIKRLKDELETLPLGSQEWVNKSIEINREETDLADKTRRATDEVIRQSNAFKQVSGAFAGFDLTNFDQSLKAVPDVIKNIRFDIPAIKLGVEIEAPETLAHLQQEIASTEEKLMQVGIDTPGFDALQDKLATLKAKMENALLSPLQRFQKAWAQIVPYVSQGIGAIARLSAARADAQIQRTEEMKSAELQRIDTLLQSERTSEAEKVRLVAERARVEAEYDAKLRSEKARAFEADKKAKRIQAVIDTASAVVEALPNPFLVAWAAAMGAIQIAIIDSQPTPKFHEGTGDSTVQEKIRKAPRSREFPILVRGGETVRTERQEADLQSRIMRLEDSKADLTNLSLRFTREELLGGSALSLTAGYGGSATPQVNSTSSSSVKESVSSSSSQERSSGEGKGVTMVFNFNGPTDEKYVVEALKKVVRKTGLPVEKIVVNPRRNIVIGS